MHKSSSNLLVTDFISIGKINIKKRARFQLINKTDQMYNLSLCTVLENGDEDYVTASKNGDMQRIFETLGEIVLEYTEKYPNRKIYFEGSDKLRTRQYQLSMFSNLQHILPLFSIEGLIIESNVMVLKERFETGKNYDAFIFTRKS